MSNPALLPLLATLVIAPIAIIAILVFSPKQTKRQADTNKYAKINKQHRKFSTWALTRKDYITSGRDALKTFYLQFPGSQIQSSTLLQSKYDLHDRCVACRNHYIQGYYQFLASALIRVHGKEQIH